MFGPELRRFYVCYNSHSHYIGEYTTVSIGEGLAFASRFGHAASGVEMRQRLINNG